MITKMLSRQPSDRPKFDLILAQYRGTIFPEYFYTFLEDYITSLSETPSKKAEKGSFAQTSASTTGNKMDRILQEWDSISVQLEGTTGGDGKSYCGVWADK
jgi:phosphoinositide-3-kinase regulatory subunit 4